jgi:hypothetical protein
MLQSFNEPQLKSSFCKIWGRYNDLVCDYKLSLAYVLNGLIHTFCYIFISILALRKGNPVYLISTRAHGGCDRSAEDAYSSSVPDPTYMYLCICRGYVLPYTRFCNCLLDYDYVLHNVNFAISYMRLYLTTQCHRHFGICLETFTTSISVNAFANSVQISRKWIKHTYAHCVKKHLPTYFFTPLMIAWPLSAFENNGGITMWIFLTTYCRVMCFYGQRSISHSTRSANSYQTLQYWICVCNSVWSSNIFQRNLEKWLCVLNIYLFFFSIYISYIPNYCYI